jgi:threonine synthase
VRAFEAGAEAADLWEGAKTVADGLRVPAAVGDFLMLESLRDSGGTAIAVPDDEMVADAVLLGKKEGIFAAPEGGATVSAFRRLRERGWIADGERTVLFVTGSGHKYAHLFT